MTTLLKIPAKNPVIRGMSVPKVKESAVHIVNKEIGRQLSAAGRKACLDIGLLLVQVLEAYELYANEVGHMVIDLPTIKNHFAPAAWAKLNTNQRLVLEAAIVAQGRATQASIDRHISYLRENKAGMDRMGPNGQAAIEARLQELQGVGEEAGRG